MTQPQFQARKRSTLLKVSARRQGKKTKSEQKQKRPSAYHYGGSGVFIFVAQVVREETGGAMADVGVDVSGSPKAIQTSVDCLRRQGTMVLAGLTGDSTPTPMLMDRFV